jgi:hypothetical protein
MMTGSPGGGFKWKREKRRKRMWKGKWKWKLLEVEGNTEVRKN